MSKADEYFEKIKPFLQLGYSLYRACQFAGLNYKMIYNHYERNEDFKNKVERERNLVNTQARKILIKAMMGDNKVPSDPKLALEWLDRMEKDEFSKRIEITGADGEKLVNPKDLLFEFFKDTSSSEG
jgi:hypothetical protein